MANIFTVTCRDKLSKARIGKLKTRSGIIETPFFMPVATKGAVKHTSPEELKATGTQAIISNALLLYLKPGLPVIKKAGGIHKFMQLPLVIFTDSGGFQILREGFHPKISNEGFAFKDPYTNKKELLTPQKAIRIQEAIGADVIMCLDDVPEISMSKQEIALKVERTHQWALRCKKAHSNNGQILFGICQGGIHKDLRKQSFRFMQEHFEGISLGGFCIGEEKEKMFAAVSACLTEATTDKPVYLMGVGSPNDILEAISRGCDIFDSVYPTRIGRRGSLLTKKGPLRIGRGVFRSDTKPIEKGCSCTTCKQFSRSYLHHLTKINEPLGLRLCSNHNIHFIQQLIAEAKSHIKKGTFEAFKKRFIKGYKTQAVAQGKLQAR